MSRGTLRIYLGAAPGVGKTYAMLCEGRRRAGRGTDVVVGIVETHGRPHTAAQLTDLEIQGRRRITYRGTAFEEMDVDAILARHPEVALVDELAHTNVPGSRNTKRWQDVEELLDAGIHVVSTVNIQHLESLNDVVERITGIIQRETVPDEMVRAADQIELVDMAPEALRRRLAHGNIYAPEKVDAALGHYFRTGNLAALRELALLWVANQVDEALESYRERHGIKEPWETRERVVVAITGAPGSEFLIRRAARIAQRAHGELLGVHITTEEGLAGPPAGLLEAHRKLLVEMGGTYHEVAGADTASALADFSRAENATQLVLGATGRSRLQELIHGSVINRVMRLSGPIDLHVIAQARSGNGSGKPPTRRRRRRRAPSPIAPRRRLAGWLLSAAGVGLLTLLLAQVRDSVGLPTVLLLFLALVVTTAVVGGRAPAFAAALVGSLAANWFFTPPLHRLNIADLENVIALLVFLGVAGAVSGFVVTAARRTADAARARAEAHTLAGLAATSREEDPLPALVGALQSAFGLEAVAVLSKTEHGRWQVEAAAGSPVPASPEEATVVESLSPDVVLALVGDHIAAEDRYVLNAFSAQLAAVLDRGRLRSEAGRAHVLAEANELRSALLQAVSHDLRTPLASIKAAASSLGQHDIEWTPEEAGEFLSTIVEETDRLIALVANLLDMSRLQVGALPSTLRPVDLEEVVPAALAGLGAVQAGVDLRLDESLPPVQADPALLERVVANVIDNAVRWSPPGQPVRVEAGAFDDHVDLRVVDRGPGIPMKLREQVFAPFQRRGDSGTATGVGLGLAVARGFVQAMHGTVEIEDTAGGGTTIVISLPIAGPCHRRQTDDRFSWSKGLATGRHPH
ncbi:MAG: two-component system, OmpR family, sensor histidine kinase KdpD [Actinomycetota bacterium]|nr:two-component system, OmpR family, sensor histidine kinase KdpD [Actinomycetota bacterium]